MKSFSLNFLTIAFILAQGIMTYAAPPPATGSADTPPPGTGPADAPPPGSGPAQDASTILFYANGPSQTWEMVTHGMCFPVVKPDGSRLVKAYESIAVTCDGFTDAECKTPGTPASEDIEAGLDDVPADYTGYTICKPIAPTPAPPAPPATK